MSTVKYKLLKHGWCGGKPTLYISSPYGYRIHPIKKIRKMHNGIDISISIGTKIYAPFGGTLTCRFQKGGAGLYYTLQNGNITLYFMHLSGGVLGATKGKTKVVKEGDYIALSGGAKGNKYSGSSTGPHLHFEYRYLGIPIDPKYIISDALVGKVRRNSIKAVSIKQLDENPTVEITTQQLDESNNYDISGDTDDSETEDWGFDVEEYDSEGERLAGGIWQIVKLAMDSDVANLRLHDTSISVQTGSLINFFHKVCQQPLVEFSGDTYGDQYFFLVRKPPFDRETMRKTLEFQDLLRDDVDESNPFYISPLDIVSANVSYGGKDIYSWYQLFPVYEMGATDDLKYIVPAVFFPEFAAIWGSRDLSVRSQYRTFVASDVYDKTKNSEPTAYGDSEVQHALDDLRYIIECNAYNAFVRSGTITLAGNRKIKRGMFIQVELDGVTEIYYVDSVQHSMSISNNSIDRTTTLQVSHGMVKRYMFDNISVKKYSKTQTSAEIDKSDIGSYFNIIDFGDYMIESKSKRLNMDNWPEIISSWKVNIAVFKFFLRKYQFLV